MMPKKSQSSIVQISNSIKVRQKVANENNSGSHTEPAITTRARKSARRLHIQRYSSQNISEWKKNEISERVEPIEVVDFVTANCQILANPAQVGVEFLHHPDVPFPWDRVVAVRCFQTEISKCPICLEDITAPRMGKCGHIYCLPCISQCFRGNCDFQKCAVCFKPMEVRDLRRVYIVPSVVPNVGDTVEFTLMHRAKQSIFPKPVSETGSQRRFLSRIDLVDLKEQLAQIEKEKVDLDRYANEYELYGGVEQANSAKSIIRKLKIEERKVRWELKNLPPPEFELDEKSDDYVAYYQAIDSNNVYLHSINWKCLREDFGTNLPRAISGKVVEIDTLTMDIDVRRKYRYLKHLPFGRVFYIAEIEFENPVITDETLKKFSEDIAHRIQNRLFRQELEFELDCVKKLSENSYNKFAHKPIIVGCAKMDGSNFVPEDFVPLEVAASTSFSVKIPPVNALIENVSEIEPSNRLTHTRGAWFRSTSNISNIDTDFPPLEALATALPDGKPNTSHSRQSRRNKKKHKNAKKAN